MVDLSNSFESGTSGFKCCDIIDFFYRTKFKRNLKKLFG